VDARRAVYSRGRARRLRLDVLKNEFPCHHKTEKLPLICKCLQEEGLRDALPGEVALGEHEGYRPLTMKAVRETEPVGADADDRELAALCKALAHPVRVRILRLLTEEKCCVCGEVVEMIGLAQSTVSEHLRILKAVGLLSGEVEGPRVCYGVNPEALKRLRSLLAGL
jgi:ArsR family transcriptional regulator, arsenate/arsenite/antimonite-responsive transcriptional repressor